MIYMINPHTIDRIGVPMQLAGMSLQLRERGSTATMVLDEKVDVTVRDITKMWFYDDSTPGRGMVWRAKSISEAHDTKTPTVQLEHVINTLKDTILFHEVKPSTITGSDSATVVSAKAAIKYILDQQPEEHKDWKLGDFEVDDSEQGYSFEGETLYDAISTVCSTLEDVWWEYSTNVYPYKLHIRKKSAVTGTMLRANRNIRTISKTTDKSGIYTRFWPVGKDDIHLTDSKSYNNDYILSDNAAAYGVIDHTETDTSKEKPSQLAAWARARLRAHSKPVVTIVVEGLELSRATGEPMDKINLGRMCEIVLKETGKVFNERIIEISYNDKINSPESVRITLSNKQDDVTKILAEEIKKYNKSSRVNARQTSETKEILYNTVKSVRVTGPTNNKYTLQFMLVKDTDWQSGGNFSRAVTSWNVSATGGTITVTAKPQEQSKAITVRQGKVTRTGAIFNGDIEYKTDTGTNWHVTGATYTVDGTEIWNDAWDNAAAMTVWPEAAPAGQSISFSVSAPVKHKNQQDKWVREQVTKTFIMTKGTPGWTGYAAVSDGLHAVARIDISDWFVGGWDDAAALTVYPEEAPAGESVAFTVSAPVKHTNQQGEWVREQVTKTFTMTKGTPGWTGYAAVSDGLKAVARLDISNWFVGGWDNAAALTVYPEAAPAGQEQVSFTVSAPVKHTNQQGEWVREQVTKTFTITSGTPGWSGYVAVSDGALAVARKDVSNWFVGGWDNAAALTVYPGAAPAGESVSFTVSAPVKHTNQQGEWVREQVTKTFTLTKGATPGTSGYAAVSDGLLTVGRINIGDWYTAGWGAANDALVMPAVNTATAYMDVVVPSSNAGQTASYRYTVSNDGTYCYITNAVGTVVARGANGAPYSVSGYTIHSAELSAVPSGYTYSGHYYYISNTGTGRNKTIRIYTFANVNVDGKSRSTADYSLYDDLQTVPTYVYQAGWDAARSSETQITMTRGAYDEQSHTYTCTCILTSAIATGSTFYLYAR